MNIAHISPIGPRVVPHSIPYSPPSHIPPSHSPFSNPFHPLNPLSPIFHKSSTSQSTSQNDELPDFAYVAIPVGIIIAVIVICLLVNKFKKKS